MSDDNVYVRTGTRSKMSADPFIEEDLNAGEAWDFEREAYNVVTPETSGQLPHTAGIVAALEAGRPVDECQTCRLEFTHPKVPIASPEKILDTIPGVIEYTNRTVWVLGVEGFTYNRDTGCREVTVYLVSSPVTPHFTDLPGKALHLRHRYFVLDTVPTPDWIQQEIECSMREQL